MLVAQPAPVEEDTEANGDVIEESDSIYDVVFAIDSLVEILPEPEGSLDMLLAASP